MKYAHLDNNNFIIGWYSDDIHIKKEFFVFDIEEDQKEDFEKKTDEQIISLFKDEFRDIENYFIKKIHFDIDSNKLMITINILDIPKPFKKVSNEEWQEAINNNHNFVNSDGTTAFKDPRSEEEIIEQAKQDKLKEINKSCEEAIIYGFASDATGRTLYYQCDRDDQANLRDYAESGLDWELKTSDDGVTYGLLIHTSTQIQILLDDMVAHKHSVLKKAMILKDTVYNATNQKSLDLIKW